MKIYSRSEFMKLPPGTVFSSGEPMVFLDLYVKGDSWEVDFLQSSLIGIDSFDSRQTVERFDEMNEKGISYPINKHFGREGLFDEEMLYLVYEKEDLIYLKEIIEEALRIE